MSKAAAAPAKKPTAKPAHPPYTVMIAEAINHMDKRYGSSRQKILKYIVSHYNFKVFDADKIKGRIKLTIRKMLALKTIIPVKGSFKLPKPEMEKKPVAKQPAKKLVAKKVMKPGPDKPAKKAAKKPATQKPTAKKAANK